MRKVVSGIAVLACIAAVVSFSGCATKTASFVDLETEINTTQLTNSGKVFYAVVRADSEKDFVRATYESIYNSFLEDKEATNIFISPEDDSLSKTIKIPAGSSVSVYFLFSKPGGKAWKYRIKKLDKDMTYTFYLGDNYIQKVEAGNSSIF
ncbi:type VI secretion system lipoprotein IglE [Lentisphaerota bacterium ZTH]|nr:hypothetical protein JYG24_12560 [Lentisphaerota bacterium]WET05682.1 type VI secretion system lipoprotein IglE [Lentisphaerota bacterium ZTH]